MADISKITLPSGNTYNIKDEVARQAASGKLVLKIVSELPTASADTMGAIYLVPSASSKEKNIKDEYITYEPTEGSYAWEQIGSTSIDLSDYAKKGDGVTITLSSIPVSGTDVSVHSITDPKHTHTVSGTTTADGTNAASSVTFASSSVAASKVKTDGSTPSFSTTVTDETLIFDWDAGAMPTFDAVNNLVDTSNSATAAAQTFTGKASTVTGTAEEKVTGITIANHTVTQGTVSGNASGTINN